MEDLISCITPTFNRSALLKKAIKSTIVQTYANWEMLIVDDNSTDDTETMVLNFAINDNRIKYFKNPGKGANAARNFGIMQATGEWIAFLDDDVENLPDRFDKQVQAINITKKEFVVSDYKIRDSSGKIVSQNNKWNLVGAPMCSTWLIKKGILLKAGLFDESFPSMQDTEISYRIAKYSTYIKLPEPLVIENNTPHSISKGMNGIKGKELLIEKHNKNMPLLEYALWNFILGMDYYNIGDKTKAKSYFYKAAESDERGFYKIGLILFKILSGMKVVPKAIVFKILLYIRDFRFPALVNHQIVDLRLVK